MNLNEVELWVVWCTDGTNEDVWIRTPATPSWGEWYAMEQIRTNTDKVPFSAKPFQCTGISYHAHMGRYCPIHPNA